MNRVDHAAALTGRRILVVDADEDVRESLTTLLENAGVAVCAVGDGDAAPDAAPLLHADLITLDLSMPGPDGGEVLADLCNDAAVSEMPACLGARRPARF